MPCMTPTLDDLRRYALSRSLFKPTTLPRNTPVTQNNVAKEAGRDPSALRKLRYPRLIREIQKWIEGNGNAPRNRASNASLICRPIPTPSTVTF